jgi:hypothetical protein
MFQFVRIKYLATDVTTLYSLSKFCGPSLRLLFLLMRALFQGSKYRTTPYETDCVCEHSELLTMVNDACRFSRNAFGNLSTALRSTEPSALRRWSERGWTWSGRLTCELSVSSCRKWHHSVIIRNLSCSPSCRGAHFFFTASLNSWKWIYSSGLC